MSKQLKRANGKLAIAVTDLTCDLNRLKDGSHFYYIDGSYKMQIERAKRLNHSWTKEDCAEKAIPARDALNKPKDTLLKNKMNNKLKNFFVYIHPNKHASVHCRCGKLGSRGALEILW